MKKKNNTIRRLVLVLGDQLDETSSAFVDFQKANDAVWMVEVPDESEYVWSHKARIALFLSAMRHFREALKKKGYSVLYRELTDPANLGSFGKELQRTLHDLTPQKIIVAEPGEWRVQNQLVETARSCGIEIDIRPDRHFLSSLRDFVDYAENRKQLRLEFFYRELRKREQILMDGNQPVGGKWNFDQENRKPFGKTGPTGIPDLLHFYPDPLTQEVIQLVQTHFSSHPGSLNHFDFPVTRNQAEQALEDFISNRLPHFGSYQDAMWTEQPYLYHSRLSTSLNLKLLDPRKAIAAAEDAFRSHNAPLASVEGFIRQILGWREYVRGVYWRFMPEYIDNNTLAATQSLPRFYWTGETDMNCLRQTINQTLEYGYAHHIQRLMVTGLFALLYGVNPKKVHEWYLAIYTDAVEWVELPNTLGMSQFADGGIMASKPYAASGKYIQRMSNYCQQCPYDPARSIGNKACPFTVFYWEFLYRHEKILSGNHRMKMQLNNLYRLDSDTKKQIAKQANQLRKHLQE